MQELRTIKGFKDLLSADAPSWRKIEDTARGIFEAYGFKEIRTPILEYTDLFKRSIGEVTDIVEKEMFTFEDRGGESLTLRPEGTAGVVRAYIEHGLYKSAPKSKLFYMGPMFRRERPQKGRLRQFHQIGAEAFGNPGALVDAEIIAMQDTLYKKLGVANVELKINSLGCGACRPAYRQSLVDFLAALPTEALCEDCRRRRETNPMRVLDCKNENCKKSVETAPAIFDRICDGCQKHHSDLESFLGGFGVAHTLDKRLVRGLDYYTRTAFEFVSTGLGSQSAVSAGGRYDNLVQQLGGPATPGVGFATGVERLAMLLPELVAERKPDIFFAPMGAEALKFVLPIADNFRNSGLFVEIGDETKGMKGLMKEANNSGAAFAFPIGENELKTLSGNLKNMRTGEQIGIDLSGAADKLKIILSEWKVSGNG